MKARDGDAQVKKSRDGDPRKMGGRSGRGASLCPSCKTEVPLKPGFRVSTLKCPKCGKPLGHP